jgi:hypothetical protein
MAGGGKTFSTPLFSCFLPLNILRHSAFLVGVLSAVEEFFTMQESSIAI